MRAQSIRLRAPMGQAFDDLMRKYGEPACEE